MLNDVLTLNNKPRAYITAAKTKFQRTEMAAYSQSVLLSAYKTTNLRSYHDSTAWTQLREEHLAAEACKFEGHISSWSSSSS